MSACVTVCDCMGVCGTFMLVMEVLFPSILMMDAAVRSFSLNRNVIILLVGNVKHRTKQNHLNAFRKCICRFLIVLRAEDNLGCLTSSTLFVLLRPSVPNKVYHHDRNSFLIRTNMVQTVDHILYTFYSYTIPTVFYLIVL